MQVLPLTRDNLIAVRVSGTFTSDQVDHLKTLVKYVIEQYEEVRLYFEMNQFEGWQVDSFVENAFFDIMHAHQFDKVAMVGEKSWQAWITKLVNLVKRGEVRYFDLEEQVQAMEWIQQGSLRTMEG